MFENWQNYAIFYISCETTLRSRIIVVAIIILVSMLLFLELFSSFWQQEDILLYENFSPVIPLGPFHIGNLFRNFREKDIDFFESEHWAHSHWK